MPISNTVKANISREFEQAVINGRFALSINLLLFGLIYLREDILEYIKRKGLFRYSKYLDTRCIIENLCSRILSISDQVNLDAQTINYLDSVVNMAPILGALKRIKSDIIREIVRFHISARHTSPRASFIRTILASIDHLFLIGYQPRQHDNPNNLDFYSKESLCEAAATLIFLYIERYKEDDGYTGVVDERYLIGPRLLDILKRARHLRDLQEYEIYIDLFSYRCTKEINIVHLEPKTPELEQAIRLGFIKTDLQNYYIAMEKQEKKEGSAPLTLEELTDRYIVKSKIEIFEYEESRGYPRYILKIPDSLVSLLIKINGSDRLFREEADLINHSLYENMIDFSAAKDLALTKDLNLFEFLKIKRFFDILATAILRKYRTIPDDRRTAFIRSLVPIIEKSFFYKLFDLPAARQKIDSFMGLLSWKPELGLSLDLQYQPFIESRGFYLIPTNIFYFANAIRNIFALEYRRQNPAVFEDGTTDLLGDLLASVFREKGYLTARRITYGSSRPGEIDFIAIKDKFMFIAECKRSLLPTGLYEIRRLYDYLKKGGDQLDSIVDAMKDQAILKELGNKIGYDLRNIGRLATAIISNNRQFVGYRMGKHPIRNIQEMSNLVSSGIIKTFEGEFCVWKGDDFSSSDLENYLDDAFYRFQYDSLVPRSYNYDFGETKFVFSTFHLDLNKYRENIVRFGRKCRRINQN